MASGVVARKPPLLGAVAGGEWSELRSAVGADIWMDTPELHAVQTGLQPTGMRILFTLRAVRIGTVQSVVVVGWWRLARIGLLARHIGGMSIVSVPPSAVGRTHSEGHRVPVPYEARTQYF